MAKCKFQSCMLSIILRKEDLRNLFTRSTKPFAHGAATAIKRCETCLSFRNEVNSCEVKAVPLSETRTYGFPNTSKSCINSLMASLDPVDFVA